MAQRPDERSSRHAPEVRDRRAHDRGTRRERREVKGEGEEEVAPRADIVYRDIAPGEFRVAAQLFYDALTALTQRVNVAPPPPELVDEEEAGYEFVARTGIFRV